MNALDRPTLEELRDRLREASADDEVRVVVLTGSGEKAFIAGADIKYMSGLEVEEAKDWGALGSATMCRRASTAWAREPRGSRASVMSSA